MAEKKSVKSMTVTKSPEILASETLLAVVMSDTIQQAADKLGISRQMVHERINKYDLTEKIKDLKQNAIVELHLGTTKAAQKLVSLLDSQDEKVVKAASDSILDRVGLTKADNNEQKGNTFNFIKADNANFNAGKYVD
jgi:hypothetical protein